MLTPIESAFATPSHLGRREYRQFCRAAGLEIIPGGWGLLLCRDDENEHVTVATSDVGYLQLLVEGQKANALADLEIPEDKFGWRRAGWPDEWTR